MLWESTSAPNGIFLFVEPFRILRKDANSTVVVTSPFHYQNYGHMGVSLTQIKRTHWHEDGEDKVNWFRI